MEHLVTRSLLLGMIFYVYNIHAIGVDRVTLEKIKKRQFAIVDFKDNNAVRLVTLEEIYGVPLNEQNFNPGEEFLNFLRSTEGQIPTIQLSTHEFDDPHIYFHEFHHMTLATQESKKSKFVIIIGDPKTGKTSTLRWMYLKHIAESPGNLAIFVDLPQIVKNLPNTDRITLNSILRATVPAHLVGFIEDVANKNPRKMKIFLDNIHRIPDYCNHGMQFLVYNLYSRNIFIVVSTGYTSGYLVVDHSKLWEPLSSETVSISWPMLPRELEDYTKQYWTKKLKQNYNLDATAAVEDYWKIFRIMTQNIPLPKTIQTARLLADYVIDPTVNKPFTVLSQYAKSSSSDKVRLLAEAIKLSETHYFPIINFYDEYFKNSFSPMEFQIYADAALGMLERKLKMSLNLKGINKLATVKAALEKYGTKLLFHLKPRLASFEFRHEDPINYFVAKWLMKGLEIDNTVIRPFIQLMAYSPTRTIQLMINSELSTNLHYYNLFKSQLQSSSFVVSNAGFSNIVYRDIFYYAIDNLITNGFDTLASLFLEKLLNSRQIIIYLQENHILNSELKYCFGMISGEKTSEIQSDFVSRTSHTFRGTRPQMIMKFLMSRTMEVTKNAGFVWDGRDFLEAYTTQPNIETLHKMFIRHAYLRDKYPVQLLNRAMYESVKALGLKSIEIVKELQILGGVPSEVDVDGNTLAHAAVKWGSLELVKTLRESYGVSFNDKPGSTGKTILFTALDAYSLPTLMADGFWPMMQYLIEIGNFQSNIESIRNHPPTLALTDQFFSSDWTPGLKLSSNAEIRDALITFQMDLIGDNMEMSEKLRSCRRNVIIQSCVADINIMRSNPDSVTLTEILTKYRGFDELSPADQLAYESTIIKSLELEASSFYAPQIQRVVLNIIRNMNADSELVRMWELYVKKVEPHLPPELSSLVNDVFLAWERGTIPRAAIKPNWVSLMLRTRYDLSSDIKHDLPVKPNEYMSNFKHQLLISICDFI